MCMHHKWFYTHLQTATPVVGRNQFMLQIYIHFQLSHYLVLPVLLVTCRSLCLQSQFRVSNLGDRFQLP